MRALVVSIVLVAAAGARAQPAASYNGPWPPPLRPPLVERMERVVAEVAVRERRPLIPQPDPRLERAAAQLLEHAPLDGRPPNEQVQAALWLAGIVEPPPHLIVANLSEGGEEAMLDELERQLPRALSEGRYRRMGAAARSLGDQQLVLVALQESGLELEALPRSLPNGGPAPLRGKLRPPYEKPEVFVTGPDGQVTRLPVAGDARGFSATFRCGPERGRYQIEIGGEDRFGAAVLANFPIYCGQAAPGGLPRAQSAADAPLTDAAGAEAEVLRLLNQDRARAGLAPLAADARLAEVGRAHSADMRAHGFVGHVSPTTGTPADRLKRAGIDAGLALENVARAYSAGEAERGLMESPGHRANILNREVTRVGVGVVVSDSVGGVRELLVTQVFVRPVETLDAGSPQKLADAIAELRRKKKLSPLGADPSLDRVAQETADGLAASALRGGLRGDEARAPSERALARLADRYRSVRTVVAQGASLEDVPGRLEKALSDPTVTTLGIGLSQGRRPDRSLAIFAVLVLAEHR